MDLMHFLGTTIHKGGESALQKNEYNSKFNLKQNKNNKNTNLKPI